MRSERRLIRPWRVLPPPDVGSQSAPTIYILSFYLLKSAATPALTPEAGLPCGVSRAPSFRRDPPGLDSRPLRKVVLTGLGDAAVAAALPDLNQVGGTTSRRGPSEEGGPSLGGCV